MGKAYTKGAAPETKLDPRIKDPVKANRIRHLVGLEILHQAWGCALWSLERSGKITQEQRRAGDEYLRLAMAAKIADEFDPDSEPIETREKETRRHLRAKKRYSEAKELLERGSNGMLIRRTVDDLCLNELYPGTFIEQERVRIGLGRLEAFILTGNKR